MTLIESLADDNFLDQVPRAGTNHPATLELFERIGLYDKLEPRGIVAPQFHYWDRQRHSLIAEFDHACSRTTRAFPYVLQCERIKIVEEALNMAKAQPLIEVRMATEFTGFRAGRRRRDGARRRSGRRAETIRGPLYRQRRRRAQHHPQDSASSSRASPIRTAR